MPPELEPPTEAEMDREFQRVGPFVYVPMTLPSEDPPTVLTEVPNVGRT